MENNQIELFKAAEVTRCGLKLKDTATELDWAQLGENLDFCGSALNWWLGDWGLEGEKRFSKTIGQIIQEAKDGFTGKIAEKIQSYTSTAIYEIIKTCRAWPQEFREPLVSFSHHMAVATRLRPAEADNAQAKHLIHLEMAQWIKAAKEKNLTVRELLLVMSGKQLDEAAAESTELFESMLVAKSLGPQVLKMERSFNSIKVNFADQADWSDTKKAEVLKVLKPAISAAESLIGMYLSLIPKQ